MGIGNLYLRAGRWMGRHKAGVYLHRHLYDPLDRWVWRRTKGRRGLSPSKMPVLMLTTTGRKSGASVTTPVLFLPDGDRYVIVGSNYGRDRHPAWTYNLAADPACEIQIGTKTVPVRARRATGDEVKALWPRLVKVWPGWQTYTGMTDRRFRVFFLEPR